MLTKSSTRGVRLSARKHDGNIPSVGRFSQNEDPEFEPIKLRTMQEIQKDTFKKHRKLEQALLKRQRHIEHLKTHFEHFRQHRLEHLEQRRELE